jgi:hypothetical protein
MQSAGLAIIVLAIGNQLIASGLDLCMQNQARLDPYTLRAFQAELGDILAVSGHATRLSDCGPGSVMVTLRDSPSGEEPTALGATRRKNGRLVPEIDLFVGPTAHMVGTRLPAVLGRALARVATHELGHFLTQGSTHAQRGVMMERLSAAHLLAPSRAFFRLPPSH